MRARLNPSYLSLAGTALVMAALYVGGCLSFTRFGSLRVLVNLFGDNAFLGVAAVGATFVILSGGIDLSIGSAVAFSGLLVAVLVAHGLPPLAALALTLAVGGACGAAMGFLIQAFEQPPFLVTLAGMFLLRGLAFGLHPDSLAIRHPFYTETLGAWSIPLPGRVRLPFTAICLLGTVAAATGVSVWTRFGRNVYAIGSNAVSARLMGVPIGPTVVGVYALSGFCAALGGCVATFYMQSGNPASFAGLELDAIAAVVIGGTLLTGGSGSVPGTLMGVLILGLIQTLITFQGNLNSWWTRIVAGALLLAFITLQKLAGGDRPRHA